MIAPFDIQDPYYNNDNNNINIYDPFYYKKSHKKKYFCIWFMSISLGYGLGILTCHLSNVC